MTHSKAYYVVSRDSAHADDPSWPPEYPFAVCSHITAWRIALFINKACAEAFAYMRAEIDKAAFPEVTQ